METDLANRVEGERSFPKRPTRFFVLRALAAAALTALAANCFLKYLWWTACYSAWRGIPKLAQQWQAAGSRATLNGWCLIVLEFASTAVFYSIFRQRSTGSSILRNLACIAGSITFTIGGTAAFAAVISWLKQSVS